ncbi:MAG: DUF1223 domain-containing protein [Gammaproteobacteria bacterium]|nr:MAG: DUF1223 domain-containing protein [Gammaproteobacteria bacterium]RLA01564.1 MAG: DUF1223 domain-containing protein [Gammaproteobacteria bacterium]
MKMLIIISLLLPTLLFAQTWQTESGQHQLAVLELFTSEGCGLCPAADRWVHNLPKQGITDEQLIVLGFHIDYLNDKKGWVDRFASPDFSDRQRQQAQINLYKTVYTPEFVVSGEVIHNWKKHVKEVVHAVNGFEPEAKIGLTVQEKNKEWIIDSHITVQGKENRQYSKLYLAVTENDIISKVSGGDNAGATFNHQNLVRKWLGPFSLHENGETDLSTTIQVDDEWDKNKIKIVALVQNLNDGFVLQGVALNVGDEKN